MITTVSATQMDALGHHADWVSGPYQCTGVISGRSMTFNYLLHLEQQAKCSIKSRGPARRTRFARASLLGWLILSHRCPPGPFAHFLNWF